MSNITSFDKKNFPAIRKEMEAALKIASEKLGIQFRVGNISYNEKTFTAKVEAGLIDAETGVAVSKELEALKLYGPMYISEKLDIDKVYTHPLEGSKLKFIGYYPRKHKNPVLYVEISTGKRFLMNEQIAKKIVESSDDKAA